MSRSGITRRERQRQTRSALLRAASRIFCRRGLDGASIDEVAEAAGYTKGAFYANFSSKEELFLVMLDEQFARELERLDRALAGEQDPGDEAHDAAADFARLTGDDEWPRLYFQFAAHAARDEDFRRELAARQQAMRNRVAKVYERWSKDFPADPPLPLEDIAAMTYFMADGFLIDRLIDPALSDELYATMLSVFFRGLAATAVGWEPPEELEGGSRDAVEVQR